MAWPRGWGSGAVDVPWHTARDGVAETGFVLAATAATCGKLAREVVELSRPEIGEVREEGGHLRGASSTMPQKANPIGSEAVVGLSILAAHHAGALLAAMQGTHERAAGEWQAEWDALPLTCAADGGRTRRGTPRRGGPQRLSRCGCGRTSTERVARSWRRPR